MCINTSDFDPSYFAIRFRTQNTAIIWPASFVIISAHATTGQVWSAEKNVEADQRLHTDLLKRNLAPIRIIPYVPETGHAEPSWAVEMPLTEALDLGRDFHQDAIFSVRGDMLRVAHCNPPEQWVDVGTFRERLTA